MITRAKHFVDNCAVLSMVLHDTQHVGPGRGSKLGQERHLVSFGEQEQLQTRSDLTSSPHPMAGT